VSQVKVERSRWTPGRGWGPAAPGGLGRAAQIVVAFAGRAALRDEEPLAALRRAYPSAHLMGCSTAGEICGTEVRDDTLVATAVHLEHSVVKGAQTRLQDADESAAAGERLAAALPPEGLVHVFVLAEGVDINGSALVEGLRRGLPAHVTATGGLAGDGDRFQETFAFWDEAPARGVVAALGLYGPRLRVGFGSLGGWDPFGPERLVTRARGNVLYELDGRSALDLYKVYLGEHAQDLPASALLFPLSVRGENTDPPVVRTVLAVDDEQGSLTFAGDVPMGTHARFMKANFDRLVDGAARAARHSYQPVGEGSPDLALLISCVGRKLVLKQRIEEEVEAVRDVLGPRTVLAGFYSYGEIGPFTPDARCELHNQTMTITTLTES
jgi:hypothetical protein